MCIIIGIYYSFKYIVFFLPEWSREALLEKWMKDPVQCCQLAGVQPPTSAWQHCSGDNSKQNLLGIEDNAGENDKENSQDLEEIIVSLFVVMMYYYNTFIIT